MGVRRPCSFYSTTLKISSKYSGKYFFSVLHVFVFLFCLFLIVGNPWLTTLWYSPLITDNTLILSTHYWQHFDILHSLLTTLWCSPLITDNTLIFSTHYWQHFDTLHSLLTTLWYSPLITDITSILSIKVLSVMSGEYQSVVSNEWRISKCCQ
jgi:hypothetical protein